MLTTMEYAEPKEYVFNCTACGQKHIAEIDQGFFMLLLYRLIYNDITLNKMRFEWMIREFDVFATTMVNKNKINNLFNHYNSISITAELINLYIDYILSDEWKIKENRYNLLNEI